MTNANDRYRLSDLLSAIQSADSVLLFPHISPDGDTLGSTLALLVFTAGSYVYNKHQWASQRLSEFEPRYARLAGLERNHDNLAQALAQSQAMQSWYLHPPGVDGTQTGNEVQQRIRSLLTSAGMTVVSSQVLPIKQEQGLERIPLVASILARSHRRATGLPRRRDVGGCSAALGQPAHPGHPGLRVGAYPAGLSLHSPNHTAESQAMSHVPSV